MSGPFQLYSKRCRSWLIHVFFAFTFPFDSRGFFHHPRSCRCFMLWDQQIPWFSVFWATHHFLMCPKCNVSYVSKMQRQMVNNTFVSHVSMCFFWKPTCHAVRELHPYFQLPSIVWVSKRFGLKDFVLCHQLAIRTLEIMTHQTCFQLIYGQPRSEASELWKTKNTEQNQIDNVTHNQAAPLNAK